MNIALVTNKKLHPDTKKRLLYPILYRICDIVTKSETLDEYQFPYPRININDLSNIESSTVISLPESDINIVDDYIKLSYRLINKDITDDKLEKVKDAIKLTDEYDESTKSISYFSKATELYMDLSLNYNSDNYLKLIILNTNSSSDRIKFLKHKICNNILFNKYTLDQVFNIYKYDLNSNRFNYDLIKEILFTQEEIKNNKKLDTLYKTVKEKFYRDIKYPELRNIKTKKFYKFRYKGTEKRNPFIYRYNNI